MTSKMIEHENTAPPAAGDTVPAPKAPPAPPDSAPKELPVEAFRRSVTGLVADIRALSDALPIAMKALASANEVARSEMTEFMEKRTKKTEGKDGEFQKAWRTILIFETNLKASATR
jgi:hypothetical protein